MTGDPLTPLPMRSALSHLNLSDVRLLRVQASKTKQILRHAQDGVS
jgi:hypothetical protein